MQTFAMAARCQIVSMRRAATSILQIHEREYALGLGNEISELTRHQMEPAGYLRLDGQRIYL